MNDDKQLLNDVKEMLARAMMLGMKMASAKGSLLEAEKPADEYRSLVTDIDHLSDAVTTVFKNVGRDLPPADIFPLMESIRGTLHHLENNY